MHSSFIVFSVIIAFKQTQTVSLTAFNLFSLLQLYKLHCSCVAILIFEQVPIFGRPIMIISCDGFTRNYFANVLGVPQPANMRFQDPNARPVRKATKMAVQQGFSFLEPQDRIAQLETAIREKLEVGKYSKRRSEQM